LATTSKKNVKVFPLNILYGEDTYGIEDAIKKICSDVNSKDGSADLNQLDAKACAMEDLLMAISSVPMFCSSRIVIVKNFEAFSSSQQDAFVTAVTYVGENEYDKFIPEDTYVIIASNSKNMPLKKLPLGTPGVNICEFKKKYERDAIAFIINKAKEQGIKIDRQAAVALVDYTGTDFENLSSEVDKLITYKGKDLSIITVDDIKAVSVRTPLQTVFDLCDSLTEGDVAKALTSLKDVLDLTESVQVVQSIMFTHMRGLLIARDSLDRNVREDQILKDISGQSKSTYRAQKLLAQCRKLKLNDIFCAMKMIEKSDIDIKTGKMSADLSMNMLVSGITSLFCVK